MKQSKRMSMLESMINIVVGFGIAVIAQAIFLPMLGVPMPWAANLSFAAIMTVISIARSYLLRRLFEALHIRRPLTPAMSAVIAERYRQIEVEGWSTTHDDEHVVGHLASAGAAYAISANATVHQVKGEEPPACWPWEEEWWKPQGFRRDLVRAGALILAEIEKCDRRKSKRTSSLSPYRPRMSLTQRGVP